MDKERARDHSIAFPKINITTLRILEVGDHHLFKQTFPEQTTLLWTGYRPPKVFNRTDYADCSPIQFVKALRDIRAGRYDLVITYATQYSRWHPRYWMRAILNTPLAPLTALTRVFGISLFRFTKFVTPLVVLDMQDAFTIHRSNFFLLDRAKIYFKRELPVDRWQAIYGSAHPRLPTLRIRRSRRWQMRIARLRPISLQAGLIDIATPEKILSSKKSDVFFAGDVDHNSTVRVDGLRQLQRLATRGIRVDMPTVRLTQDEFYRRMSEAWLAWSPSGRGWDCYRHYEAPQCLTVPIINYPTILRYRPLEEGVHAIYYPPEGDGLMRAIEHALSDKERLKRIALAGREHVRSYHVASAFCLRILNEALHNNVDETY
jgi:hypothetical protein